MIPPNVYKVLLHQELNDIYQVLTQAGLSDYIARLKWEGPRGNLLSYINQGRGSRVVRLSLVHSQQEYYCKIDVDRDRGSWYVTAYTIDNHLHSGWQYKWPDVKDIIRKWATQLGNAVAEPDYWLAASMHATAMGFDVGLSIDDAQSSFTPEEKVFIRHALELTEQNIERTFQPTREEMAQVRERLYYLANAVDRLNRYDWKGVFLQTLISIGINLTVDTEGGRLLFETARSAFAVILKLP